MIAELRQEFNRRYTDAAYESLLDELDRITRTKITIRVAETPVFLPAELLRKMIDAGAAMTRQLVQDAAYLKAAARTVPPSFRVAAQDVHPHFMTADFGLMHIGEGAWRGDWSTLEPRLVELQAFPSVFGLQSILGGPVLQALRSSTFPCEVPRES